jgi:acetyl esterase/lipase
MHLGRIRPRGRHLVAAVALFATLPPFGPSLRTTAEVTAVTNIVYKSTPTIDVMLDAYTPPGPGPFPSVLIVHGRSWKNGSRTEFADIATDLANEGFVVYATDFRMPCNPNNLSPSYIDPDLCHYPFPTPTDDIGDAIAWVRQHGADYNGRTDKIGIVGSSTGGNEAMEVGVVGAKGGTRADVVVSWSGVGDLTIRQPKDKSRENYVGCSYTACPDQWVAASPARRVDPPDAPLYLSGSTNDKNDSAQDQQATIAAWSAAGVPNQRRVVAGTCHARECVRRYPVIWDESVAWLHQWLD